MNRNENELEELFEEWRKEQENKRKTHTLYGEQEIHPYFCKDGYINKEEYNKAKEKILFILKEPNVGLEIKDGFTKELDDQRDFYRGFFNKEYCEPIYKKEMKAMTKRKLDNKHYYYYFDNNPVKQKEKMARIAQYILGKEITDDYEVLKNALNKVAFMNLNKSGGNAESDMKYFIDYCNDEKFSDFIIREIEIINPTIIILIGGNAYEEQLNENIKNRLKEKTENIFSIYHTSARGKSLNISEREAEILNGYFESEYNYKEDLDMIMDKHSEKNKLHMRKDKNAFKYLLKFIAIYKDKKNK